MAEWRNWFDSRLDNAIEAASTQQHPDIERKRESHVICLHAIIIIVQQSYKNDSGQHNSCIQISFPANHLFMFFTKLFDHLK